MLDGTGAGALLHACAAGSLRLLAALSRPSHHGAQGEDQGLVAHAGTSSPEQPLMLGPEEGAEPPRRWVWVEQRVLAPAGEPKAMLEADAEHAHH